MLHGGFSDFTITFLLVPARRSSTTVLFFVFFFCCFSCATSLLRPIRLRWSIDKFHPTRPVEAALGFLCAKTRKIDVRAAIVLLFHLRLVAIFAVVSSCFPFSSSSSRERFQVRDGGTFQISQINDLFPLNDRGSKLGQEQDEEDSENNLIS